MALAHGKSEVRCGKAGLSLHTQYVLNIFLTKLTTFYRTAIWVAQQLTDAKFVVEEEASGHTVICCDGIGYTAPPLLNVVEDEDPKQWTVQID